MTELKTLKDLETGHREWLVRLNQGSTSEDQEIEHFCQHLRQEAIKWVKGLPLDSDLKKEYCFEHPEDGGCYNVIHWIKNFFNITEEELK